ncbi:MAG: cob(I)yrinic acid a,c-diamide adenosyltransferase [Gemmatimonadota bacterium]
MKIYTRTGDKGQTALFGGGRVSKDHLRVEAYGTVDELNSVLGVALPHIQAPASRKRLERIQHDLFVLGSHLATPAPETGRGSPNLPALPGPRIAAMEAWMDEAEEALPPLKQFILPGGSQGAAALHLGRTVCRRAERTVVVLARTEAVDPFLGTYLNRLSDLLFMLARVENFHSGIPDTPWKSDSDDQNQGAGGGAV